MADEQCCVVQCERPLDDKYWDAQYLANTTGWDLGEASPPIKSYFENVTNKHAAILIPGCGNSYEAEYLLAKGFTNITIIDIAPSLIEKLQHKFKYNQNIKIVLGDFFIHEGSYDYIIEQTFFCALPVFMRQHYVFKMYQLLKPNGLLVGLLFNRTFDVGPPFGGNKIEYEELFSKAFHFVLFEQSNNSVTPRANTELFIVMQKNSTVMVNIYNFAGITCNNCVKTITQKYAQLNGILNVSVSTDFKQVLIVSSESISIEKLRNEIDYEDNYQIEIAVDQ